MAKKKRNLKPDIILKNYWRDNERFADLFNAVLFGGEQEIQPDELVPPYWNTGSTQRESLHQGTT